MVVESIEEVGTSAANKAELLENTDGIGERNWCPGG